MTTSVFISLHLVFKCAVCLICVYSRVQGDFFFLIIFSMTSVLYRYFSCVVMHSLCLVVSQSSNVCSVDGDVIECIYQTYWHRITVGFNPRRACAARVIVLGLCVCVSVCLSVCPSLFSHYRQRRGL